MHLVTKNIASSPRQHDDIAALEGANGWIAFLDFKNAASLNHDQEGDILAVRCGGVSPGSCEGMDACDQPVETNRVEHILQHVNGHPAGSSCGNICDSFVQIFPQSETSLSLIQSINPLLIRHNLC